MNVYLPYANEKRCHFHRNWLAFLIQHFIKKILTVSHNKPNCYPVILAFIPVAITTNFQGNKSQLNTMNSIENEYPYNTILTYEKSKFNSGSY